MLRPTYSNSTNASHARAPSKQQQQQRSSRACDQCRKLRIRCVRSPGSDSCQNCSKRRFDCTAETPDHKRGPPRGYLHQLEERLHDAEALLGVFVSLPTPHMQQTLTSLSRDPQASAILNRVNHSAFGPSGRNLRNWLIDAVNNSEDGAELRRNTRLGLANDTADVMVTLKTNRWQDQLIRRVVAEQSEESSFSVARAPPPPLFTFDHNLSSPTSSDFTLPVYGDYGSPDYSSQGSQYSSGSDVFSPQPLYSVESQL